MLYVVYLCFLNIIASFTSNGFCDDITGIPEVPTLIQDVFLTILFLNNREAAQMAQLNNRAVEATEIGLVATLQTKEVPNKFDCVWWFN